MFPKKYRFESRIKGEFFATAVKKYSDHFILYTKNNGLDKCRAAVIVPKKVISTSIGRSRYKRVMRNLLLPYLDLKTGRDLVLYLKSFSKKEISNGQIKLEINSLLTGS